MNFRRPGSVTERLTRSLLVGLTLLWLAGVFGSGIVLKRLIDEKSDDELQESGMILMTLVRHIDDPLVTAALLGESMTPPDAALPTSGWSTRFAMRPDGCSCGRAMRRPSSSLPRWSRVSPTSPHGAC